MKEKPEPEKFKCKCGCSDFKMDIDSSDLDVYSITVDTDKAEYSIFSLKPLAECEEYQAAKRMQEYVESGGRKCPFCDSDEIEGAAMYNCDVGYISQGIKCLNCKKAWEEIFTLTDAKEREE